MRIPIAELLDLLAAASVRSGRCRFVRSEDDEADAFFALLERK